MSKVKEKLKNIKKVSIIGMLLSVVAFGAFYYIGHEADEALMILDHGKLDDVRLK